MSGPKNTDTHAVKLSSSNTPAGSPSPYASHIYSVYNSRTGEEVERVEGFGAALAAKAKWDSYFAKIAAG